MNITETYRSRMIWAVLEAAKDNNDADIIAACRRCITAQRLGWKKYNGAADFALIRDFAA